MKLALSGQGKMGQAVERVAAQRGHQIAVTFSSSQPPREQELEGVEVLIDFSHASAIDQVFRAAWAAGVPVVTGTTGWNDRLAEIREKSAAAGIAVVHAANFSPGANLLFALARRAAELAMKFEYAAGIEERHHAQKKDAPSGTAIRIASEVSRGSEGRLEAPIVSSRVGSEFGLHTLFFDSPDDLIELSHRARGRDGFARGAVIAAELIADRTGFFSFEELIGL